MFMTYLIPIIAHNHFEQAENRAAEAERTVSKLQKEVDRLEGQSLQ